LDPNFIYNDVRPKWKTEQVNVTRLELLDEFDRSLYTFSSVAGLADLYENVAYRASGAEELMDAVLGAH
jgi:hypothetical protein